MKKQGRYFRYFGYFSRQVSNHGTFTAVLFNNCDWVSINYISWLLGTRKLPSNSRFVDLSVDMVSSNATWKAKLILHVHILVSRMCTCTSNELMDLIFAQDISAPKIGPPKIYNHYFQLSTIPAIWYSVFTRLTNVLTIHF